MPLVISLHLKAIQCSATFCRICKTEKILNIRIVTVYCLANRRPQCILANKDIRIAETLRRGSYTASQRRNLQPLFDLPGPGFNQTCQIIRISSRSSCVICRARFPHPGWRKFLRVTVLSIPQCSGVFAQYLFAHGLPPVCGSCAGPDTVLSGHGIADLTAATRLHFRQSAG